MVIVIAGFGLGQMLKEEYTVYGVPGQTKEVGDTGYELSIDEFEVKLREDGTVDQYTSVLTMTDTYSGKSNTGEASVNHPLSVFGMKLYQNSTGWAATLDVYKDGEKIQEELLCAGEYAASAAGHPALRITSAAPAAGADSADDEPYADYYDHCGHEQLPQQRKIQYLLIAQQRYHADAQEYSAACFVALGDESDKARDDEKQRPPAVKKYVYVRDAERVERKDDANRYEGYAPKDPACLFHIVSP